jgi:hypothetical protein
VLVYDDEFQNFYPADQSGGITGPDALLLFSVSTNPASGQGSLTYDDGTGVFTYTPPNALLKGGLISELVNDENYIDLPAVGADGFIKLTDLSATNPITIDYGTGLIAFDNALTGYINLTQAKSGVTLNDVVVNNGTTISNISVGGIEVTGNGNNDLGTITVLNQTLNGNLTSTNGTITLTNGNLTVGGAVDIGGLTVQNATINRTSGDITINTPGKVDISNTSSYLSLPYRLGEPSSPALGDVFFNGDTIGVRVRDMEPGGGGSDEWHYLGGANAPRGFVVPRFSTTARNNLSPVNGEMIVNVTDNEMQVYYGGAWRTLAFS